MNKFKGLIVAVIAAAALVLVTGCDMDTAAPDSGADSTSDTKAKKPGKKESVKKKVDSKYTSSQKQAIGKAEEYLSVQSFSKKGLIEQLKFEQFSAADAKFAANHIEVDWNEQAEKKAKEYLDTQSFSESALADQLKFDGFTDAQAKHGAAAAMKD